MGTQTRARFNWTPERVKVIKEHFGPVAITVHGSCKDAEGEFWKSFSGNYAWITGAAHGVTPGGKVLCATGRRSSCGGRSVCDPRKALERWKALPASDRRPGAVKVAEIENPDPEFPKRPPGSLILKGYNRPLERGKDGELKRMASYWDCQELSIKSMHWKEFKEPEPGRTFLWLSNEQWRSLLPPDPRPGKTYPVPDPVADRLVRLPLLNTIF